MHARARLLDYDPQHGRARLPYAEGYAYDQRHNLREADNSRTRGSAYEEYHPYGSSAYRSANGSVDVSARRYRYNGKERDEETGLYYYGARYLAAWLGRWTSADPLGIGADGPGLYNYTRGSPVNYVDPNGTDGNRVHPDHDPLPPARLQASVATAWVGGTKPGFAPSWGERAAAAFGGRAFELVGQGLHAIARFDETIVNATTLFGDAFATASSGGANKSAKASVEQGIVEPTLAKARQVSDAFGGDPEAAGTVTADAITLLAPSLFRAGVRSALAGEVTTAGEVALVEGTGRYPTIKDWRPNPSGPRQLSEIVEVGKAHGVAIPEEFGLKFALDPDLAQDTGMAYHIPSKSSAPPKGIYRWEGDFASPQGDVRIRVHPVTLYSDEAIVANLAHELHELTGLHSEFASSGWQLPGRRVGELITPGAKAGNLHDEAWNVSDRLIVKMRKGGE